MTRTDVTFRSGDDFCAAWLYQPDDAVKEPAPIVVLAHGVAGVKEMRLDAFAERFAEAGYQCLVFDYRHFGASGGEPRQLLDIKHQQEDWRSAVAYARSLDGVDPERVAIWGSSFGGGHVLYTAARDQRITAVISQCPFTDGLASSLQIKPVTSAKLTALALRDALGARLGRQPVLVPAYGKPGTTALMTTPDSLPGISAQMPHDTDVPTDVAARFVLNIIRYFPGRDAAKVKAPVHFAVCEHDSVAPTKPTLRYARKAPRGEIKMQPAGHFDIYVGDDFENNVNQQLAFLRMHVPLSH